MLQARPDELREPPEVPAVERLEGLRLEGDEGLRLEGLRLEGNHRPERWLQRVRVLRLRGMRLRVLRLRVVRLRLVRLRLVRLRLVRLRVVRLRRLRVVRRLVGKQQRKFVDVMPAGPDVHLRNRGIMNEGGTREAST